MIPFALIAHFTHYDNGSCSLVVEFICGTESIFWVPVA